MDLFPRLDVIAGANPWAGGNRGNSVSLPAGRKVYQNPILIPAV